MSILGELSPATVGTLIVVGLTGVAIVLLFVLGCYRASRVRGPVRGALIEPVQPWVGATVVGAALFFSSQLVYGLYLGLRATRGEASLDSAKIQLSPFDMAVAGTIPGILAAAAMLGLIHFTTTGRLPAMGMGWRELRRAAPIAGLGLIVLYPTVHWAMLGLQGLYHLFDYHPPQAHELLESMTSAAASPMVKAALMVAAVVVAPFFEELLFRGGIQTLLRWGFADFTVTPIDGLPRSDTSSVKIWAAIALTSLIFAAIHPWWMAPGIFLLSVILGYIYERTGNLWACVLTHALFNGTQTFLFHLLN